MSSGCQYSIVDLILVEHENVPAMTSFTRKMLAAQDDVSSNYKTLKTDIKCRCREIQAPIAISCTSARISAKKLTDRPRCLLLPCS